MNYSDMFKMLTDAFPVNEMPASTPEYRESNPYLNMTPQYVPEQQPLTNNWGDEFISFKQYPVLYNLDGFISPYATNNWGDLSPWLGSISDESRLPAFEPEKIDPNRIFSAELNNLRSIGSDQQRAVKLFEKKLFESLTEKGKFGLNEEDIEAMQALTAARSAVTATTREQVNIKKNITDAKIKLTQQQSAGNTANNSSVGSPMGGKGMNPTSIGKSMLDSIFDFAGQTTSVPPAQVVNYSASDAGAAGKVLDTLVPAVDAHVEFESREPSVYVVVGADDSNPRYEAYSPDGEYIPDYPVPSAPITTIDREAGKAINDCLVSYPLKEE